MKLSPYYVHVPHYPHTDTCILYSTLNGSAVCISSKLYNQLLVGMDSIGLHDLPLPLRNILEKYFLVDNVEKNKESVFRLIYEEYPMQDKQMR